MATKTWYVLNTAASSPGYFGSLQDGGTAPTAANTSFGWQVGKTAVTTPFYRGRFGASGTTSTSSASTTLTGTGPVAGTGSTSSTAGDSFRTPTTYTGTFAAGAWTISFVTRPSTATTTGRLQMRVWASVNADGSSARELTSGTITGSIVTMSSTSTNYTSALSWSPAAITLDNEYIFFKLEWEETTAGSANGSNCLFRVGSALVTSTNLVESHTLVASGLSAGLPVIDAAAPPVDAFSAPPELSVPSPTISQGVIAQTHALGANALEVVSLALASGQIAQTHVLSGVGTVAGAPVIDSGQIVAVSNLLAASAAAGVPEVGTAELALGTDLTLMDRVFDLGLTVLRDEANEIWIVSSLPVDYAQAVSFKLGNAPSSFGNPDTVAGGRRIMSNPITGGVMTAVGTAIRWVAVDTVNSRMLATGKLSDPALTNVATTWALEAISIVQPR